MQSANSEFNIVGFIIGILIAGIFCGLIPLITGIVKKRVPLGIAGFVSCLIGSGILGIFLAIPIAIIFTVIIALKKNTVDSFQNPPEPPAFNE